MDEHRFSLSGFEYSDASTKQFVKVNSTLMLERRRQARAVSDQRLRKPTIDRLASARLWDDGDWLLQSRQEPHLFGAGNASGLAVPELARALKILPHSPQLMDVGQTKIYIVW